MADITKNKNSVPSFTRGTLEQLKKAIADGKISPPAFHFLIEEDKKCLAFLDVDWEIYEINVGRISKLEKAMEGLINPETGEVVPVIEYVQPTIDAVEKIKKNGATIMITSDGGDE